MRESAAHPLAAADVAACALPRGGVVSPCPLGRRLTALEVQVVDDAGEPAAGVLVELRSPARGAQRRRTARDGVVRFEGVERGAYELWLPELDRGAWAVVDASPLADESAGAPASWGAPSPPPAGQGVHVVAQGDSIASIAQRFGYTPDALWAAPENAALAASRAQRNVLLPGDRVALPARGAGGAEVDAGLRHRVRRRGGDEELVIRFVDAAGAPRAGVSYILEVDNARGDVLPARDGETDGRGVLRRRVPPDATVARVTLATAKGPERYRFALGHLDPIDAASGLRSRLKSLGYLSRERPDDAPLADAVRRFQQDHGLPPTGEADGATLAALRAVYLP